MADRFRVVDLELVDRLVAVGLFAAGELQVWLGGSIAGRSWAAVAVVAAAGAVAVRRRWPLWSVSVVLAFMAARMLLGTVGNLGGIAAANVAIVLLFYGLGAFAPVRRSAWMAVLAVAITSVNSLTKPGGGLSAVFPMEAFAVLLPYALGRVVAARASVERASRDAAERLDSALVATASTAADGERARIARELHDVIAHSVSVMVIQAGGARLVMDAEPARAEESLRSVELAGREALAELRRLLGILGEQDPQALAPQPGLSDIAPLLAHARRSGIEADLRVDGQQVQVAPALELCAYRIVQESLTNAIKHAAPALASVNVRWCRDALELEISDEGRRRTARTAGGAVGHGIPGMRERVALHSGTLEADAGPAGGFTVRARLPLGNGSGRETAV